MPRRNQNAVSSVGHSRAHVRRQRRRHIARRAALVDARSTGKRLPVAEVNAYFGRWARTPEAAARYAAVARQAGPVLFIDERAAKMLSDEDRRELGFVADGRYARRLPREDVRLDFGCWCDWCSPGKERWHAARDRAHARDIEDALCERVSG